MTLHFRSLAIFAVAAVALTACRKQPEPTPAPVQTPTQPPPQPPPPPPITRPTGPSAEEIARMRADSIARVEAAAGVLTTPIYFDYNASEVRSDARAALDAKIPIMNANPQVRIRISGHADERGSDEYNLVLSQQRAAAARRYLEGRGIAASRIDIVGYGEERPAMTGASEDVWAKNRRDEFEIIAGRDMMRGVGQ